MSALESFAPVTATNAPPRAQINRKYATTRKLSPSTIPRKTARPGFHSGRKALRHAIKPWQRIKTRIGQYKRQTAGAIATLTPGMAGIRKTFTHHSANMTYHASSLIDELRGTRLGSRTLSCLRGFQFFRNSALAWVRSIATKTPVITAN